MTYARYFIPKYIKEDKVLYLDSDLIVNSSLVELFNIDLENHYIGAVIDPHSQEYHKDYIEYNAGVLLVNNALWKEVNL